MASVLASPRFVCRSCIKRLSQNGQLPLPLTPLSQTRGIRARGRIIPRSRSTEAASTGDPFPDSSYQPRAFQSLPGAPLQTKVRIDYDTASRTTLVGSLYRLGYQKDPLSIEEVGSDLTTDQIRQLCKDLEADRLRSPKSPKEPTPSPSLDPPPPEPTPPPFHRHHLNSPLALSLYWETTPPTISEKNQSRTFFTQKATPQFLRSIARFREFPESDVPEVAFVGRSNVGKSSLLNALVNSNAGTKSAILARTSATPGCTRTMNLYGLGPKDGGVRIKPGKNNGHDRIVGVGGVLLVDLPGYGEGSLAEWGAEIMKYLTRRKQLRRVFVLVDALHGVKEKDLSLLAALRLAGVPHQVVLSKVDRVYVPKAKRLDRISKGVVSKLVQPLGTLEEARERMLDVKETIQPAVGAGALGELLSVSAEVRVDENRLGVDGVRFAILRAAGFRFEVESASGKQKMGKFSAGSRSVYVPSQREHVSAVDGKKNKMVWA